MMLSVTGCGSTTTGDVQTLENPEIMSKSDEELSDVLENSIGLSENTDSDKDETVYVIADAAGNKQDVIVSEWLKNTDGEATIKDSSNLTDIEKATRHLQRIMENLYGRQMAIPFIIRASQRSRFL